MVSPAMAPSKAICELDMTRTPRKIATELATRP